MKKWSIILVFSLFATMGCKKIVEKIAEENGIKVYQGYNINGKMSSCVALTKSSAACTDDYGPQDRFGDRCKELGHTNARCGCHSYLCSAPIDMGEDNTPEPTEDPSNPTANLVVYEGYNMSGRKTSCSADPKAKLICTKEYRPGDAFADECRKQGNTSYQCACHTFLCSKPTTGGGTDPVEPTVVPKPKPKPGKITYQGYDMKGTKTSCVVDPSVQLMCTMNFGPGDQYGASCKARGYEAYSCGCHSYLCSRPLNGPTTPVEPHGDEPGSITYKGYNADGQMTSCTVTPGLQVMCLVSPPWAKRYKTECQAKGATAYSCYCENYLCSQKITFDK